MFQSPGWSNINPKIGGFPTQLPWERNSTPVGFSGNSLTQKRVYTGSQTCGSFRNYSHADESSFQVSQKPPSHTRWGPQCNFSPTLVGPQEITRKKRKEKENLPRWRRVLFRFRRNLYPTTAGSATLWGLKDKAGNLIPASQTREGPFLLERRNQRLQSAETISVQLLKTARVSLFYTSKAGR